MESSTFISTIKGLQNKISTTTLTEFLASDEEVLCAKGYFNSMNAICNSILSINPSILVSNLTHETYLVCLDLIIYFDHINVISVTVSKEILAELSGLFTRFVYSSRDLIGLATITQTDIGQISRRMEELDNVLLQAQGSLGNVNSLKADTEKIKNETTEVLNQTKVVSGEVVVAKFGKLFKEASDRHDDRALIWLSITTGLAIMTIIIAASMLNGIDSFLLRNREYLMYTSAVIVFIGLRLVIFSVLLLLISMAIKNYKANKHNEIINKHRQNALDTFETFVKSTLDDKAMKNAILLEVTKTIFSNLNTGFSNSDNDNESTKYIEIIKEINK